jgi:hypothetical protein
MQCVPQLSEIAAAKWLCPGRWLYCIQMNSKGGTSMPLRRIESCVIMAPSSVAMKIMVVFWGGIWESLKFMFGHGSY